MKYTLFCVWGGGGGDCAVRLKNAANILVALPDQTRDLGASPPSVLNIQAGQS